MAVTKVTQITRQSVNVLRGELNTAIKNVLDKHGLVGVLGNITFNPGIEFRCKLNVVQPKVVVKSSGSGAMMPKVGDVWMYGAKSYKIVEVRADDVVVENVKARPKWGRPAKRYRMPIATLQSSATFVR